VITIGVQRTTIAVDPYRGRAELARLGVFPKRALGSLDRADRLRFLAHEREHVGQEGFDALSRHSGGHGQKS
jgi:hypothetical protein